jgi:hypothetical protein
MSLRSIQQSMLRGVSETGKGRGLTVDDDGGIAKLPFHGRGHSRGGHAGGWKVANVGCAAHLDNEGLDVDARRTPAMTRWCAGVRLSHGKPSPSRVQDSDQVRSAWRVVAVEVPVRAEREEGKKGGGDGRSGVEEVREGW